MLNKNKLLFFDLLKDSKFGLFVKFSHHLGYPNFLPLALGIIDPADTSLLNSLAIAL